MLWTDDGSHCGKDSDGAAARKQEERLQLGTHTAEEEEGEEGKRGEREGRPYSTSGYSHSLSLPTSAHYRTTECACQNTGHSPGHQSYRISGVLAYTLMWKCAGLHRLSKC